MKRRLLTGLAALMLLMSMALPMAAHADSDDETTPETTGATVPETTEETEPKYSMEKSGTCGKNLTWRLEDHTLIITGDGKMDAGSPWGFYKDSIYTLILDGEITVIGDEAFSSCNNLQYIDFGDALVEIGQQAFYSCNALEAIRLPASFRKFGPECFRDCENLQVVFCEGPMPSFKSSCLYTDHTVSIYYTAGCPWPQESVDQLVSNFGGRLAVNVGSEEVLEEYLEDMPQYDPSEWAPTEPETQPETEPETLPATQPTVPATQPTVPETTAPAQVQPTVQTQPQEAEAFSLESEPIFVTEPEEPAEEPAQRTSLGIWVWVIIAAAAITGILILAILIRMILHNDGRYSD